MAMAQYVCIKSFGNREVKYRMQPSGTEPRESLTCWGNSRQWCLCNWSEEENLLLCDVSWSLQITVCQLHGKLNSSSVTIADNSSQLIFVFMYQATINGIHIWKSASEKVAPESGRWCARYAVGKNNYYQTHTNHFSQCNMFTIINLQIQFLQASQSALCCTT